RNTAGRGLSGPQRKVAAGGDQDSDLTAHELRRHRREPFVVAFGPLERNRDVLAINPAGLGKSLAESRNHGGARLGRAAMQIADKRGSRLLRPCRERPSRGRPAEQSDELAPPDHSITSSARSRIDVGNSTPSALAVWRLMTSSNFVACSTGKSPAFAPLRILAT